MHRYGDEAAAIARPLPDPAGPNVRRPARAPGEMTPVFVLVHSMLLGPRSWAPVVAALGNLGAEATAPSLVDVTAVDSPPFWPAVADRVAAAAGALPAGRPVAVVAHSNAGLLVPVIVSASPRPVAGCVFVDARLPAPAGSTPTASPERLEFLRGRVTAGRLPPWTEWWAEDDVARLFPDPQTRAAVSAEQPCLPLSYYEQRIPAPAGWDDRPCGYLLFEPAYAGMAGEARERGWTVDELPGGHLHQLVDPAAVAARLLAMARSWSGGR